MLNRFVAAAIVIAGIVVRACYARSNQCSQHPAEYGAQRVRQKYTPRRLGPDRPSAPKQTGAPAPARDLTGIWEPIPGYRDGVFATGPKQYPSDGKPEHELPFTPLGLKTWKEHKPGFGTTAVPIAENNDPFDMCDPIGFPRIELFNLRAMQFFQNKNQVAIVYQNDQAWRNIWMDGRVLPKPEDVPSRAGTDIRWASGWTTTRLSWRRWAWMKGLGWITLAGRIAMN